MIHEALELIKFPRKENKTLHANYENDEKIAHAFLFYFFFTFFSFRNFIFFPFSFLTPPSQEKDEGKKSVQRVFKVKAPGKSVKFNPLCMQAVCKHKYMRNIQMNHHILCVFVCVEHSLWKHQLSSKILTAKKKAKEQERKKKRRKIIKNVTSKKKSEETERRILSFFCKCVFNVVTIWRRLSNAARRKSIYYHVEKEKREKNKLKFKKKKFSFLLRRKREI